MAASAYGQRCHLLTHDDVIGTRAVSFIIYLPEDDWTAADGGALELYSLTPESHNISPVSGNPQGLPAATPSKSLVPKFNTMMVFGVAPGRSYHSVQEVFTDRSPRLSIQGWYHAAAPPVGAESASLNQLKQAAVQNRALYLPVDVGGPCPEEEDPPDAWHMSAEDRALLTGFVNPLYLREDMVAQIREQFCNESCVQLKSFLDPALFAVVQESVHAADELDGLIGDERPEYDAGLPPSTLRAATAATAAANSKGGVEGEGTGQGWSVVGPAHMQRYLQYTGAAKSRHEHFGAGQGAASHGDAMPGVYLGMIRDELFKTPAFARLLRSLTNLQPTGSKLEIRRFRPGLDYTVAHHGLLESEFRLDATLCFADASDVGAAMWESEEVGGFECYIPADEEDTVASEVYQDDADADDDDGPTNINACSNTLNLVMRGEGTMRFIKYVSAQAIGSRWDVSAVYSIEQPEFSPEEGDIEEAGGGGAGGGGGGGGRAPAKA